VKEESRATWCTTVQINSEGREQSDLTYNFQADCGLTVVGREQSNLNYNSANQQWRKGAEQPDAQWYKLPVKKGSTATWHTTVQITSEERKHSDLTHNIAHYGADRC